jgi:hypothetical protein
MMLNIDPDPIDDELQQGWPKGTISLLLASRAGDPRGIGEYGVAASRKDYIDWAVDALLKGYEAPSLYVLAGLGNERTGYVWDAENYFDRCIRELKMEFPEDPVTLLRAYLFEFVSQIALGDADPCEALDRIYADIVHPLHHSQDLMPWCFLWDGFWRNTEEDIVAYAKSWIENGPDILLSWLSEGLEVSYSPNPVRARRGGLNGQRYEWVFETKVRAIDKPVRIGEFGTFLRQRGRWVFSTPTGRSFSAEDFADHYSCPRAILRPGESFSALNTVSSDDLRDWKASWYFKGVAPPRGGGRFVKGTAVIEGMGEVEE